ncbi:Uncharacterised protein [Burkholderia oklahomensis]|nr:hypothetical protein BG90_3010 [Burkholderia oklahomensis C6786]SUW56177.1 Uncharacterised protein [Burkholderia oklahomensis]
MIAREIVNLRLRPAWRPSNRHLTVFLTVCAGSMRMGLLDTVSGADGILPVGLRGRALPIGSVRGLVRGFVGRTHPFQRRVRAVLGLSHESGQSIQIQSLVSRYRGAEVRLV